MRSKLRRYVVADASEKEISLVKPDGKTPMKLTWVEFYQKYPANLSELISKFIENGKVTCKQKDGGRLSLQSWARAMMGAALTMRILYREDRSAAARAEQVANDLVKEIPGYVKIAQAIFPDIEFNVNEDDTAR